ncbi:MAG: DNA mismatch repair endonuclease MutL [Rhabdochlamydiaceae bacterium]|nr:DNA mismatch repair endonuclease MutL [Rhabdochlamydiaceae bacterium]
MAQKIYVLSEETINQIAAGEVIENPASVIKELVENAVDAGASKICVETWGGGHLRIRITDNGFGMNPKDAVLSLTRHATSKIKQAEDLTSLGTMGFRGEALASIAAISKMILLTAEENATATSIDIEGGKILDVSPSARARGTTIDVRSLFYNVPARKKFQKSAPVSTAEITKIMTQLVLAHPDVAFELIHQERAVFSIPLPYGETLAEKLIERSRQLLGEDFEKNALKLECIHDLCTLAGVIGSPVAHRHNRTGQYLFVNNRPVACPLISYAIRDAYATRLGADRHPIYALHITIPAHLIDVNVHPQKKEIRLREEKGLRDAIQKAVGQSLQRAESFDLPAVADPFVFSDPWNMPTEMAPMPEFPLKFQEAGQELSFRPLPIEMPSERTIGVFSHYLILEDHGEPSLILVDLHAVQARLAFDRMLDSHGKAPVSQGLLIPLTCSLSIAELSLVEGYASELAQLGFDLHSCGKQTLMIDALPSFLDANDAVQCIREILESIQTLSSTSERLRHLARTASQFAKRQKTFPVHEAQELYQQLQLSSSPQFCPMGRPTMIRMKEQEIQARFLKCDPN